LGHGSGGFQLSLANGVHDFNASDHTPGRPKRFEVDHAASPLPHDMISGAA